MRILWLLLVVPVLGGCLDDGAEPAASGHSDGMTFMDAWGRIEAEVAAWAPAHAMVQSRAAEGDNTVRIPAEWGFEGPDRFGADVAPGDGRALAWMFVMRDNATGSERLWLIREEIQAGDVDVPDEELVSWPVIDSPEAVAIAKEQLEELTQEMFRGNYTFGYRNGLWRFSNEAGNDLQVYVDDRERKAFATNFEASVPPAFYGTYQVVARGGDQFVMQPADEVFFLVDDWGSVPPTPGSSVVITFTPPQAPAFQETWTPGAPKAWNMTAPPGGLWQVDFEVQPIGTVGMMLAWCAAGTDEDNPACQ